MVEPSKSYFLSSSCGKAKGEEPNVLRMMGIINTAPIFYDALNLQGVMAGSKRDSLFYYGELKIRYLLYRKGRHFMPEWGALWFPVIA